MALGRWLLRCTPGLSVLALFCLLEYTFCVLQTCYHKFRQPLMGDLAANNVWLLSTFTLYSILLHVLSIFFPIRLWLATWSATKAIDQAHRDPTDAQQPSGALVLDEKVAELALDGDAPTAAEKVSVIMAIIIPSYKEDISTLEDTLNVLASHPMASQHYHIFLAMEERDPNATSTARLLLESFTCRFLRMQHTVHPADLPGEAPGKSSNVGWAAREVETYYNGSLEWKNVLVTTMDSDTHLLPQYFEFVRAAHGRNRNSGYVNDLTLYMPPICFDRNAHLVPRLVRVADLMWCSAGLSCFLPRSTPSSIAIPTAVYTMPLSLVHLANGWDTGPSAIGEDMHMMLKCYFATNGRMRIESIPSPASQCNISTPERGIRGWILNHKARYNQGLRHMWGCLDTGFAIYNWLQMGKKSVAPATSTNDRSNAGTTDTQPRTGRPRKLSHTELTLKLSQYALHGNEAKKWTWRNFILFSRLFEAHILPAHLVIMIIVSSAFDQSFRPALTDTGMVWVKLGLSTTAYMRAVSYFTLVAYFGYVYERYHHVCISAREREMRKAGLLPPVNPSPPTPSSGHKPSFDSTSTLTATDLSDQMSYRGWKNWMSIIPDCALFPVAGTIFGSVCLFQACLSHFWTEELVYLVSAKPVRAALPAKVAAVWDEESMVAAAEKV